MGLFTKDIKTMDDLFVHTLRDIYYAEKQILKALPTMVEKATDAQLKQAFQAHLGETKNQVTRLEQVFKMHGVEAKGIDCPAIDGIIEEADEVAGDIEDKQVLDAGARSGRAGRRALRDRPLRHADRLGEATRTQRLRERAAKESGRGESGGQEAHRDRGSETESQSRELTDEQRSVVRRAADRFRRPLHWALRFRIRIRASTAGVGLSVGGSDVQPPLCRCIACSIGIDQLGGMALPSDQATTRPDAAHTHFGGPLDCRRAEG